MRVWSRIPFGSTIVVDRPAGVALGEPAHVAALEAHAHLRVLAHRLEPRLAA